jgi:hypothetical protein
LDCCIDLSTPLNTFHRTCLSPRINVLAVDRTGFGVLVPITMQHGEVEL